jgi:hypothetical protein
MLIRKTGHLTLLIIAVLFLIAAALTLVPNADAYKANLIGGYTICPFTPVSTGVALLIAALCMVVRRKFFMVRQ